MIKENPASESFDFRNPVNLLGLRDHLLIQHQAGNPVIGSLIKTASNSKLCDCISWSWARFV